MASRSLRPYAVLLIFSFAMAAGSAAGADPLIARAQQMSAAGDSESASRLYRSWLDLNPEAPGSAKVFSRYFHLERDVAVLLDSCDRFLSANRGAAGEQLVLIARLFELAGRVESARDAYLAAYAATGAEAALLSSALLSLEMNDINALVKSRESLKGKSGHLDPLVGALISLQSGDDAAARAALLAIADDAGRKDLSLKALWMLFSNAAVSGDQKAMAEARRRMTRGFPGAPETALASESATEAGRTSVVALPRPDLPVQRDGMSAADTTTPPEAGAPMPAPSSPDPATPPPAAQVRMDVQAGSFQVRENADYLAADLLRTGFRPIVREEAGQGVVHYRVFAGTGLEADQAKELLSKLVQAGFSGFLVAAK